MTFNGTNFLEWNEQVQFHLGVLDLDLALRIEKHADITDLSSTKGKTYYKKLEKIKQIEHHVYADEHSRQY